MLTKARVRLNDGKDTRSLQVYLGHKNIQPLCAIPNWRRTGSRISGGNYESRTFTKPIQKLANLIVAQSDLAAIVGAILNRDFYGAAAPFLERDHIGVAAI
jgi:hypothetical protein